MYIDEATLIPEESVKKLNAIVRGANDFPKRTYYTCNPNGVGLQWFKRLFIDRKFKDGETPEDYNFIRSLVYDNDVLMKMNPDYVRELEALPPKVRSAWLEGNFDAFEGQVFEEWRDDPKHYIDRKWTHVIQPFEIPDDWRIYRGYDFGYSRPFAVSWYTVSHDNTVYNIQELYGCTQTANEGVKYEPKQIAQAIREVESTDINLKGKQIIGIADPAIFDEQRGESIAQMMEREGVYHEKADNTRLAGLMQCHYRLSFNDRGIPKFYVFTNCKHFIRTVPLLIYDEKKVEDVDTSMEDHIYDEWRYVMMENPINPPIKKPIVKDVREDPLDLWKDNYSDNIGRYEYITY
jgi:hypothetical protein